MFKMLKCLTFGIVLCSCVLAQNVYYVDSTGNDSNTGTKESPFYSLASAVAVASAGDTIYMRGGTYNYTTTIKLSQSGTSETARIYIFNYPGEHPILNFSGQTYADSCRGILLSGDYWYLKGLEICYAGDNGIKVEGSHNRIELCITHDNKDTGIQLGFGHIFEDTHPGISSNDGTYCAYNYIYNCDSYYNYDTKTNGGNADGFACKMHNGIGNVFRGCRSWHNSDDGWDLFETDFAVVMDSCWTWASGYQGGNGNGFKLGGDGTGGPSYGVHVVSNSISFNNKANAFTNNSHEDGEKIINCLAWLSGKSNYNYYFEGSHNSGKADTFYNNVSIPYKKTTDSSFIYDEVPVESHNSWQLGVTADAADYNDTTETAAMASRQADGSLPTGFAQLVTGSDLIDQGLDIGIPFAGDAPDLGPIEYGTVAISTPKSYSVKSEIFNISQVNNSVKVNFITENRSTVSLKVFNMLGKEVISMMNGVKKAGEHELRFNSSHLTNGMYTIILYSGNKKQTCDFMIAR